jgi:hypothetical protein
MGGAPPSTPALPASVPGVPASLPQIGACTQPWLTSQLSAVQALPSSQLPQATQVPAPAAA